MKLLEEFGWALLGLAIFIILAAIDHQRRKHWQRNGRNDFNK